MIEWLLILCCLSFFVIAIILLFAAVNSPNDEVENYRKIDATTVALLYILSFFIPLAGFIVGAIYVSKDEEHYKYVGKNCLIFSVMNIIFSFIMLAFLFA